MSTTALAAAATGVAPLAAVFSKVEDAMGQAWVALSARMTLGMSDVEHLQRLAEQRHDDEHNAQASEISDPGARYGLKRPSR